MVAFQHREETGQNFFECLQVSELMQKYSFLDNFTNKYKIYENSIKIISKILPIDAQQTFWSQQEKE